MLRPKHTKPKNTDGLCHLLLPSVLSMVICCMCLIGSTLAWFQEGVQTGSQKLTSANYAVTAVVAFDGEEIPEDNGTYSLEAGKTYTVTLTAVGNATTGYCILKIGDQQLHTEPFPTPEATDNNTISFDLTLTETAAVEIIPQLGFSAKSAEEKIKNGDDIISDVIALESE